MAILLNFKKVFKKMSPAYWCWKNLEQKKNRVDIAHFHSQPPVAVLLLLARLLTQALPLKGCMCPKPLPLAPLS